MGISSGETRTGTLTGFPIADEENRKTILSWNCPAKPEVQLIGIKPAVFLVVSLYPFATHVPQTELF